MTQGTLIRKLCTYTQPNPTRHAIFEFDKLIRSIYTLRYLRNPQLQRNVQRSQNRLEILPSIACSYRPGRRQEGTHRQDRHRDRDQQPVREADRERDHLLQLRHPVAIAGQVRGSWSAKVLALIKKVSPAAWRHIHLNGRYTFRDSGQMIDLDAIVAGLSLA